MDLAATIARLPAQITVLSVTATEVEYVERDDDRLGAWYACAAEGADGETYALRTFVLDSTPGAALAARDAVRRKVAAKLADVGQAHVPKSTDTL